MTKLNHDRPIFRYLDNVRREMRNAPAGTVPDDYGDVPITLVTGSGQPRNRQMPLLNEVESEIAFGMIEALSVYVDAELAVIATLPTRQRKGRGNKSKAIAARNIAEKKLVRSCARFLLQGMQSKQLGREQIMTWYGWLHGTFVELGATGACSAWETLNDWAMKSASEQVDELIEQAFRADTPGSVRGKV